MRCISWRLLAAAPRSQPPPPRLIHVWMWHASVIQHASGRNVMKRTSCVCVFAMAVVRDRRVWRRKKAFELFWYELKSGSYIYISCPFDPFVSHVKDLWPVMKRALPFMVSRSFFACIPSDACFHSTATSLALAVAAHQRYPTSRRNAARVLVASH